MKETFFGYKVLVKKIIDFKERHQLTYQQLGDALGVDKSYINRVVKLKCFPSLPILNKLAQFMNIPLYFLFLPSDEMIRQEFIEKIKSKIAELKITNDKLGEKTGLSPIRLMDLLEGSSNITKEERSALATALHIDEDSNYHEEKMNLLEGLILDLDLKDNQKDNILQYIKDNIK